MHPQAKTLLALIEAISEEFYLSRIGYYCFLPVYFQEEFPFDVRDNVFQRLLGARFASAEDNHVVCIADKSMSPPHQFMIQLVEHDVRKKRT